MKDDQVLSLAPPPPSGPSACLLFEAGSELDDTLPSLALPDELPENADAVAFFGELRRVVIGRVVPVNPGQLLVREDLDLRQQFHLEIVTRLVQGRREQVIGGVEVARLEGNAVKG